MLLLLTVLSTGVFAFAAVLWMTGFGAVPVLAGERLARIKGGEAGSQPQATAGVGLRRRAAVRLAGFNLVSVNIVQKWTQQLDRAGLTLTPKEYFILRCAVGAALTALGFALSPIPQLALLGLPLGYLAVGLWLKRRISSRRHRLEAQMIELLQMLSSGLRAGFGLLQALEGASDQVPAPLSVEIRRTLRDTAMGASVEQALTNLNERVGSSDFDIVITAILIQRNVGGNLAEILDNVAHTMRERERIRGEIRTLTSQQRLTGYVIGFIPFGLGAAFMLINPDFTKLLFTDSLGRMMLMGALIMEGMGFFVINRIVNIEV
ncbi:MAG: type II secretion system F family protein [Dehalococcoidia bacterium]|nr:type II secretion system F family protein [Dehalococcoidia bacterium]